MERQKSRLPSPPASAKGVALPCMCRHTVPRMVSALPAIMNDNYFTLMAGEKKNVTITFDEKLLDGGSYKLVVTPYNN